MKLYEITDTYKRLLDTEELTEEELAECLANVQDLFNDKALNIGKLILSLQAEAEGIDTEIERLARRREAILNRVKSLKSYLTMEMTATRIDKVKDEILTISLVNNPPSVTVFNENVIPENYWRIIPEQREVDKKAILEAYKSSGIPVDGTEIITDKKHVVIR